MTPRRGEVWRLDTAGFEALAAGRPALAAMTARLAAKPVLVISDDTAHARSAHVTVCPIEPGRSGGTGLLTPVLAKGDPVAGVVNVPMLANLPKRRLAERVGELTEASLWRVEVALRAYLGMGT